MKKSDFEHFKNASLSNQLIKTGRLINERGLAVARDHYNLPSLKQSHLDLFPHIDFEGTSISEIAKRKGVSKQSVSKLVQELVQLKILYLKTDQVDSRSKRVFFKTSGPYAIQNLFKVLQSIDQSLLDALGEKPYKSVLKKLDDILEVFQTEANN